MARIAGGFAKIAAVVFTSVVAPVLVDVAIREEKAALEAKGHTPAQREEPIRPQPIAMAPPPVEVTEVIAHGCGATPEEALQDALRTALCRAIVAQVDADTWARRGPALFEGVARHGGEVIRSWKDLGAAKQWRLRGPLHHRDVAVEVNHQALVAHLRTAAPAPRIP